MLTNMIVIIISIVFLTFFVFYKRNLLMRIFSINTAEPANKFQQQLEQTADEIISRMESKIAELDYLLELADKKILKLQEQIELSEASTTLLCSPKQSNLPENILSVNDINEISPFGLDQNTSIDQTNERLDNLTNSKSNQDDDDKRKIVLAMAEQGYNITEISKATGKGKGEIMLLLQLHKR